MKVRLFALCMVSLAGLLLICAIQAQEAPTIAAGKSQDDMRLRELQLQRQFSEFEQSLLRLKQRLERSPKQEDRDRAETLDKVLAHTQENSIGIQFEQMAEFLKTQKLTNVGDIQTALVQSNKLAEDLRTILDLMRDDPNRHRAADEILRLKELLKKLDQIIHEEKVVQGQTDVGKTDAKALQDAQAKVSKKTAALAQAILPLKKGKEGDKSGKGDNKGKPGDPSDPKGNAKDAGKPSEAKPGEAKTADGKPGEPKSGDPKSAESKPGETAPGSPRPDINRYKDSEPDPNAKQAKQKDDKEPADPKDPGLGTTKKYVEDANYKQNQAEDQIAKKNNRVASEEQGKAIQDLEKARKKLEELLRQLREEENERLLAALQQRCEKMLAMQMQVLAGTEDVARLIDVVADKKPTRDLMQRSLKLSDQEKDIVSEASKALEMIEAEGSAVAFPEVFMQVREDMKHVQRRLEVTDVAQVTQAIEHDIIDTLKEMIEALKKARQDNQGSGKSSPSPSGPPPDQKLLDQIAELKMIRSMQIRVNTRTLTYGQMYQAKEGEQTADPGIRLELSNLSDRQERIFEVTNRIARGDNK